MAEYGEWEKIETHPDLENYNLYNLNTGWFKGKQELGLHVNACIFRDRLEIFNHNTKEFIFVDGPSLDLPTFQLMGKNQDLYIPLEENPFTYRDVSITENYIYALYGGIGEFEFRKTSKLAEKVYVFTYEGEPVSILELDRSIRGLTVDGSKKKMYGITTDENTGIAVINLPEELN